MTLITYLDFAGVTLFAATGALTASRKQMDIIGFVFLAAVTGIGGGTIRDLILDVPVFWLAQPYYLLLCATTAIVVFFTAHFIEYRYRLLLWLDAVALAAFCTFGAHKGLLVTESATVAIVMGTFTAALGGILRDVLAREPSVLMGQEIYVTAAMAGAAAFVGARFLGFSIPLAGAGAFVLALGIRGAALAWGWRLPVYKSRPGRPPEDFI